MNFALERYKEQIIVNDAFRDSLAMELVSNDVSEGTILLVANEILFGPNFILDYHSNGSGIPGKCGYVLVADSINMRGGSINLSAFGLGGVAGANKGGDGHDATEDIPAGGGGTGQLGNPNHAKGRDGNNIKVFCKELVDIQIISNGGKGGIGGQGGPGGNGGKGGIFRLNTNGTFRVISRPDGQAGKGGPGGPGGPGGNGGMIEVFFCSVSPAGRQDFVSNGGGGGDPGFGGAPGRGIPPPGHNNLETLWGERGAAGSPGDPKPPVITKVETSELWEMASIELGIL